MTTKEITKLYKNNSNNKASYSYNKATPSKSAIQIAKENKNNFFGTEAEIQNYSNRIMEVAELLKKNPDSVVIGNPPKTTNKVQLPTIPTSPKDAKQGDFIPGRIKTPEAALPEEKHYVSKEIYDAAVEFNKEYDKAMAESEKAEPEQKRKNLLIAFTAKNGVIMADDPRLNELLDPNDPRLGTVGQAVKDFGAAPKAESEEEVGVLDEAKKQKILDDIIGFKKFQSETPGFKKQPSDIIEDITKPKQLDGQTFYNSYALNRHLKDKEVQSITEKAAQEISKKYWLAGDIVEFASKRISDEEAKNKRLNADIHNIVNGHKAVSVGDENYKYSKLTEDEKMLYNYFVMEQTSDMKTSLAGRYLKALELDLEQRAAVDIAESMNGFEKSLYLFGHGVGGSLESIANIGGDFGYDPTEGEMLASAIIEGEENGFAKFVYQSISTVSEQIPALAVGFATGGAGYSAVLSANIMSKSIKEAMQNNKTLIQGISYGAVQASMELALERMLGGIGGKFLGKGSSGIVVKTLNKIDDIFTGRIPKALLKGAVVRLENGVGEFTQEFIQGITDPAIKNIIYQENNTYSLGTLNEALYQGLLGAVSGMFLGGGANAAQTTAYYETLGDSLSDSQVLDFAKEAGNVKSELYRELSEKARKGKELTAVERGMLSIETTDLIYNNSTFTKETLKFMATEGSVKQISDVLFGGNTEAAEIFKEKFSDSEYVDSLMFGENDRVDASFAEKALNPAVSETDATEAMAEGQTVPTAEGETTAEVETAATDTEAPTDSIAHPAPTSGKVLKMTPVSAKAKNFVKDIAKRLGTNLEFVDIAAELAKRGQNVEGLVIYPEGFYDPETHTLYIGNDTVNPVEVVFKHELTHYGERSKYYADFARAVRDSKAFKKWLDTQATYTAKDTAGKELQLHLILKERYKGVKNLTEPEAQREVIANFVADVLFKGDVETLSEILNEATPTRKNAVIRFLSDFFSWLKSKFTGSKQIVSEIADLENMFRELIGDAAVNPMPTESGITYDTAETEANESMSVANENQTKSKDIRYSVPATDQAYLKAVENGDMETAQRMVDEAAKENGYTIHSYHGTRDKNFTEFKKEFIGSRFSFDDKGFFFIDRKSIADDYAHSDFDANAYGRILNVYLKVKNPLLVNKSFCLKEGLGNPFRDDDAIGVWDAYSEYFKEEAEKHNADGITLDDGMSKMTVVFDPNQIKSADPVTYDDNGNVIPLSERFNPENNDIRFSVPASEGKAVTSKSLFDKVQKGEISYEEFVKLVDEGWSEAGKTYGVKPDGEMVTENNKPANVPNKVAPDKTVRRFVRNVLEANYSKDFNNALKSETLAKNKGTVYEPQSNAERVAEARKNLAKRNAESATRQWLQNKESSNPQRIVEGEALLVIAEQEGRIHDALDLTCELAMMFTDAAQKLQAATILKRLGSIGKLYYLQRTVNMLNQKIAKNYKNAPKLSINESLAAQLLETKTDDEADLVINAITADLGQQMPANWLDKWNTWRYMAMLVNPTTHIRNLSGNLLFKPTIFFSEIFSATIQKGVGAVKGETFEKTTTFKANKRDKEFARKDWEKRRKWIMSSGKYEDVSDIEDNRTIYKNALLEGTRKGNLNLLEWEDGIFLKNHYIRTLARYLTANKINPETASEAQLRRARDYARKKAQEYTYRDASKFASWMSKSAREHKAVGLFFDGIIPFKKTPINVFRRGIEYSPLGFIKSLTTDFAKLKKGVENDGISLGEWIDGFAASLTGTGLLAFGALLSLWGVVKIDFDDEDEWFRKLSGEQEFSIQIGDFNYTVDWAAPSSMPFFMGATYAQVQSDEDTHWFDNLLDSAMAGLNPIVELSMLQGVNDLLESLSYGGDDYISNFVGTSLTSYFSQGLPTVGGKLANLIDDTRRTKYIDKNGSGTLQNMYDIIAKKVPFLSMTRAEYIDAWGREEHTGNVVERFFSQFVSPGYASTVDPDPIYDELKAVKESTGEAGVYPEAPEKEITFGGVKRHLSKEEYYNVATMSGQTKMNLVNEAMDHKFYDKLTDEQKAEVIKNIYKYANSLAITSELDFTLDEIKAGLGDKKGSVLTESRWNGFSFEQQQYLTHEAFMDGVITAYKYEQNGGSAAEYFILKALRDR